MSKSKTRRKKVFDKELTENERRTLLALIEIQDGSPKLVEKRLKDIGQQTQIRGKTTHKSYQQRVLTKLQKKGIIRKKDLLYSIRPEFMDIAIASIARDRIQAIEGKGCFDFSGAHIFGIRKEWYHNPERYPEINYIHEVVLDVLPALHRLKYLKMSCLIKDFNDSFWKDFLASNVPAEIKYWMYNQLLRNLPHFPDIDLKNSTLDERMQILRSFGLEYDDVQIYQDAMGKQYDQGFMDLETGKKVKHTPVNWRKKELDIRSELYGPQYLVLQRKYQEFQQKYDAFVRMFIDTELTEEQKKMITEIYSWMMGFIDEVNNIVFFVDAKGLQDTFPFPFHMKLPDNVKLPALSDVSLQSFREKTLLQILLSQAKDIVKDMREETVENIVRAMVDVYNGDRGEFLRFWYDFVSISEIVEPEISVFSGPEISKLAKEIYELEKCLFSEEKNKKN